MDAWLIYRCTSCDGTWNRPVLERRQVGSIDPALLSSLSANDPEIADRIAFDIDGLRHWAPRFVKAEEYSVAKEVLSACAPQPRELRILCAVPYRVSLRLDRLLADELDLSRSRIHALSESGELSVEGGKRALRKPVRDGAEVRVSLPAQDAEAMASRASEAAS
ncbi:MAG: DUF1062 domain-containing protein [Rhizobiaceae bacterium]|nr:DUF1062 domain-containing protein [Rhizobiaceae bacterium]